MTTVSKPFKIITILGARPQFIKAAAVSRALAQHPDFHENLLHTGQHFDTNMSEVFFSDLGIPKPIMNLNINGGTHGDMTGRQLAAIEKALLEQPPNLAMVYGDTNSTLAGALAACKLHIPVVHVEAGLRSFNRRMPEEINRIMVDHLASLLFAPTETAMRNLGREGIAPSQCHQIGDVMCDAALMFGKQAKKNSNILNRLNLKEDNYILTTIHRAENTDTPERLQNIVNALIKIAGNIPVVWPLHPRTRNLLRQYGLLDKLAAKVHLTDPIGYLDMVMLEQNAVLIATDSGGMQKEAFFYKVPCVTLRDETEWTELVDTGWNKLAPPDKSATCLHKIMTDSIGVSGQNVQPYGKGNAAELIVKHMAEFMTNR